MYGWLGCMYSEELRLLHRYALADIFDELSACICEEIELRRLEAISEERQKLCDEVEAAIQQKEQQLQEIKDRQRSKFESIEKLNMQEVAEMCVTTEHKGNLYVQPRV